MPTLYRIIKNGCTVNYRNLPDATKAFSDEIRMLDSEDYLDIQLWRNDEMMK